MSLRPRFYAHFVVLFLLSVTGLGCQNPPIEPITHLPTQETNEYYPPKWQPSEQGFESILITNEGSTSTIGTMYAFDPTIFRFAIEVASTSKSVAEWMNTSSSLIAVMNGAYFREDGSPAGLLIHEGLPQNARRFDADKSAVIRLDPEPAIIDTNTEYSIEGTLEAAQSYPPLIYDGHFVITEDTGKMARRSFVGIRDDGFLVLGVIAKQELSLYELSQLLNREEYRLNSALNMDGGSSTGLFTRDQNLPLFNSVLPIPNVISVYKKSD